MKIEKKKTNLEGDFGVVLSTESMSKKEPRIDNNTTAHVWLCPRFVPGILKSDVWFDILNITAHALFPYKVSSNFGEAKPHVQVSSDKKLLMSLMAASRTIPCWNGEFDQFNEELGSLSRVGSPKDTGKKSTTVLFTENWATQRAHGIRYLPSSYRVAVLNLRYVLRWPDKGLISKP